MRSTCLMIKKYRSSSPSLSFWQICSKGLRQPTYFSKPKWAGTVARFHTWMAMCTCIRIQKPDKNQWKYSNPISKSFTHIKGADKLIIASGLNRNWVRSRNDRFCIDNTTGVFSPCTNRLSWSCTCRHTHSHLNWFFTWAKAEMNFHLK